MEIARSGCWILAGLSLFASCRMAQSVRPAEVGDWRINGQSNAMLSTQDGGDFGDTDAFRIGASAGRFIAEHWMLEGVGSIEATTVEDDLATIAGSVGISIWM